MTGEIEFPGMFCISQGCLESSVFTAKRGGLQERGAFKRQKRTRQEKLTNGKIAVLRPVLYGEGGSVNMQQETVFGFCKQGLTHNRLGESLQRDVCPCLPSEIRPKRTLRLGLERSGAVECLTQFCHELADLDIQKIEGSVSTLERKRARVFGVGVKTDTPLIIS